MDDPDGELVRRIGEGDEAAIAQLVRAKLPRMLALGQRLLGNVAEAEDVTQELFLRVWRDAAKWRPGKARFDTWVHRVALNLCNDRLRRRRPLQLAESWDAPDPAPSVEATIEEADRTAAVDRALGQLPPRQREAIVLTYYQALPNLEAAAVMQIGTEALESLLERGRRALRAQLGGGDV